MMMSLEKMTEVAELEALELNLLWWLVHNWSGLSEPQ
jgi:hypothetical protein